MDNASFDSKKLLYSGGSNDECYTPAYGVTPILKYIPEGATVWCPFDWEGSEFVKQISKQNTVTYSHLEAGQDFFTYEPDHWDVIVSNHHSLTSVSSLNVPYHSISHLLLL